MIRTFAALGLLSCLVVLCQARGDWRVVLGRVGQPHEFPSLVAIHKTEEHVCGGTLVDDDTVLTAAHCIFDYAEDSIHSLRALNWTVIVGEHDIDVRTGREKLYPVVKIIKPVEYKHRLYYGVGYDVALLKLGEKVTPGPYVRFAKLATEDIDALMTHGSPVFVAGWGSTDPSGKGTSHIMKTTSLTIMSNLKCRVFYIMAWKNPSNMCAIAEDRSAPCKGDSGGPLYARVDGEIVQVGLVSYSRLPCGAQGEPTVFTRVATFLPWIQEHF